MVLKAKRPDWTGLSNTKKVPLTLNKTRPTADTEEFFTPVPFSAKVPGDKKKRVKCTSCTYALKFLFIIQIFS